MGVPRFANVAEAEAVPLPQGGGGGPSGDTYQAGGGGGGARPQLAALRARAVRHGAHLPQIRRGLPVHSGVSAAAPSGLGDGPSMSPSP